MEICIFCPTSQMQIKQIVPSELWSVEQDVLECGGALLYKKDLRRLLWRRMPSNREDYLEGEVLEALLRIFVHGATSQLGLPACRGRYHVARITEIQQLRQLWVEVKREGGDLVELVERSAADRSNKQRGARNINGLPTQVEMFDNVLFPIHLATIQHWLLAHIDVDIRRMHLLDTSEGCTASTVPELLVLPWIWFAHCQRRELCLGTGQSKGRFWVLDWENMEIDNLSALPGFTPAARKKMKELKQQEQLTATKCQELIGAAACEQLRRLNISLTAPRESCDSWECTESSTSADAGWRLWSMDCAFWAWAVRECSLRNLRSFDIRSVRTWMLKIFLDQGCWRQRRTCMLCGMEEWTKEGVDTEQSYRCEGRNSMRCQSGRQSKHKHMSVSTMQPSASQDRM